MHAHLPKCFASKSMLKDALVQDWMSGRSFCTKGCKQINSRTFHSSTFDKRRVSHMSLNHTRYKSRQLAHAIAEKRPPLYQSSPPMPWNPKALSLREQPRRITLSIVLVVRRIVERSYSHAVELLSVISKSNVHKSCQAHPWQLWNHNRKQRQHINPEMYPSVMRIMCAH